MEPSNNDFESRARERVGKILCKRYTLEALVGVGGMAAVYAGCHRNGNRVAVKILHPELSTYPDIRERFLREGYVANKVEHEGTVRVLDDDTDTDGTCFIVMDLLEGETLEDYVVAHGGTVGERSVVRFTLALLDVLTAAHERGIIHRDLKPENLFVLRRDASLRVLDFGIARVADSRAHATKTKSGAVMGTPAYMAPEQARGETKLVDGRTDLWAVGAIAFRLLTGGLVHDAPTREMSMVYAATTPVRPLADVAPSVNARLASIVDRALAMKREDRFASAREMSAALGALPLEELADTPNRPKRVVANLSLAFDSTQLERASTPDTLLAAEAPASSMAREPDEAKPTTTSGLASARAAPTPPPSIRSSRPYVAAGILLVAIVGAATIFGRLSASNGRSNVETANTTTSPAGPSPTSSMAGATPSLVIVATTSPTALPIASATTSASSGPSASAASSATRPPPISRGVPQVPASKTTVPTTKKPNACEPPWTLTAEGTRHYKPECIQ